MSTNQWNVTKQMMAQGNAAAANPGDLHVPIGRWDPDTGLTWNGRALMYAPVSFTGMTAINEARLYLKAHVPSSGWHAKGTTTTYIQGYRKTADWSETSHGGSAAVDELWGSNGQALVTANYANFVTGDQSTIPSMTNDAWYYIVITGIVQAWFTGSPNYGVMLYNTTEANSAYAKEFWSRHQSGSVPYIWIDYSTNTAPNAPINLSPTGSTVVQTGTTITMSGNISDPDANEYQTGFQIITYRDDGTTLVYDTGIMAGNNTTFFSTTVPVTFGNTYYKWKARTKDKAGVWGPYSALQRFKANSAPGVPSSLSEETDTLSPTFSGSFSDPDPGDGMTQIQIEVLRVSDSASMWASGDVAKTGTSWSKVYAGSTLAWSVQYKWRVRTKDSNSAYSAWSNYRTWTPIQPVGPVQSPRTTTAGVAYGGKINDTTPDLTLTYGVENFKNHEIFVYSDPNGTNQVFSSTPADYTLTGSKVVTCTTTLTNGNIYYWKARVKVNDGTWTQWAGFESGQSGTLSCRFYVNALPTAATGIVARENASESPLLRLSDGVYLITGACPMLEAVFNDPDVGTYGDSPSARQIEIYDNSDSTLIQTAENTSPAFTIPMRFYPGTVSGADTTLAAAAAIGDTNIKVTAVTSMAIGDTLRVGPDGGTQEAVKITNVGTAGSGGTGVTITPALIYDHGNTEAIKELTTLITNETTYKMRWRFKDNSGVYGAWSEYVLFKRTAPSTVTSVTPSGTITSPAFTSTWNHSSPGGKAQGKYRVRLYRTSDETELYDSGDIVSSTESHPVPAGYLVNSEEYRVEVDAVDTDGL